MTIVIIIKILHSGSEKHKLTFETLAILQLLFPMECPFFSTQILLGIHADCITGWDFRNTLTLLFYRWKNCTQAKFSERS